MLLPVRVDVPMDRWPVANYAIMAGTVAVSVMAWLSPGDLETSFHVIFGRRGSDEGWLTGARWPRALVLDGWSPTGMLGCTLLHANLLHLIGNLVFLSLFGNAVCAKVGNARYAVTYASLGLAAAVAHNLSGGGPAIGASGAINGIVGMYLVLYPLNDVDCLWTFGFRHGEVTLRGHWFIELWVVYDIVMLAAGHRGVAYWAHLGGFAAGVAVAWFAVSRALVRIHDHEQTLRNVLTGRPDPRYPEIHEAAA